MQNTVLFENNNTKAFYTMAWISFGISFVGTVIGLYLLDTTLPVKGFFAMSYLFTVSSCFTVAKVVRDKQEGERLINKVENAKTERLINEYVTP
ncbi:MAG: hypothetical protein KTR26_02020 [Flammeovirgaceae bacterium]|nr:hypothetical protein [Flammeovirgaceae bacterium]